MASNRLAKVVITLDGSRVEVGLDKIRQKTQEVVAKMQTLANAGKQNTKEYKECVKALNTLHKAETDVASVQQRINTYMKELGNVATTDLRRAYREGIQLREGFKGTDKELQKLNRDLAAMKAQIDKNTGATTSMTKAQMGFVGSLKTTLKNLVAYAGVFALFNQIKGAIISIGKKNLEFSDELTNIRKVSQLAEEDINKLANSLAKIDTRSSVHELNNLAYAGAKLGMQEHGGVAALESFVKAADKVNVALKEDLGDDALVAMSKLVEVMGLIPKMGIEKSMDAAGSAIFTLSTSSTATGANIIEFSKRLMGLANVSHVTTAELLALGSASDAMGLMPEVSSTAFNKVFTNIQSNTAAIEKSLDFTKGALQELINDGKTMEAMTAVFTKMHGMSMAELKGRGVFQALGSDGARLNNVMTTMADRVDMLTQHLEMSNKAFEEGTAVQKEYEMQMESAQGYMERSANLWEKALVNPEGVDAMKEFAKAWYNLSQTLSTSTLYMGQIKLTLKGLITVMEAIITLAPFLIDFFMLKGIVQGIKYLNSMRLAFLANKAAIEGMTEAQLAANKAMKANVYIAIAAAVVTLGQYIYELSVKTDDAEKAQERLNGAMSEGAVAAQREVGHLNNVIKALDNAALSQQGREKVISDFNQQYGQYINALGIEIKTVDDLRKNYDALAGAIRRAAYERVRDKFKEQELEPLIKASIEAGSDLQKTGTASADAVTFHDAEQAVSNFSKAIQTLTGKNLKKFRETYKQELQAIGLDPEKATVEQIKAKSTPADTRKIFNRSVQNGPRSLNEYLMNLIDKGEIKNATDAYKNIIMKEFSEGAKFGAEFDENLNYVVGQRVVNGVKVGTPVTKGTGAVGGEKSSAFNKKLYENVEKFVDAYLAVKNRGDEIDSAFDPYIRVPEPQGDNKIKPYEGGGGGGDTTNKKEADETKKKFDEQKKRVEGLIAKIDQWYNLQDATINDFAATGKITEDEAKKALEAMKIARNIALEKARTAVASGDDTEWKKFYTDQMSKMMIDHGEWSTELFKQIGDVDVKTLHDFLATITDPEVMAKLDASSFFDTMRKKAAESKKVVSETQAKAAEELNKMLLKYEYFDKAARQFASNLIQIGALGTTAEQMAQGMEGAPTAEQSIEAVKGMLAAMLRQGTSLYQVNPSDAKGVADMIRNTATQAMTEADYLAGKTSGEQAHWFDLFPAVKDWMENPEKHKQELENFYQVMLQAEQDYYQKRKQSYDHEKRQHDERFRAAGYTDQASQEQSAISNVGKMKDAGIGASFMEQQGLGSIANDPEVLAIQNLIKWRQLDVQSAEDRIAALKAQHQQELADLQDKQAKELALRQAANATDEELEQLRLEHRQQVIKMEAEQNAKRMGAEDLLKEYKTNLFDQEMALATKVAQEFKKRVQTINTLTKPIQDGAQNIGRKFGEMIRGVEEDSMTWDEIWRSMAQAVGDSIIDMMAQYAQNMIMEKMMNDQSKSEALSKAQVDVAAGTASAAAKTVGQLGWWGLALIPVIAAVLHGLLAAAFASNKQSDTSKSPNTKLVSGMLTYDEGNVGTYLGQDGRVYHAREDVAPPTGLITKPIATTVQGQPALVAEKGPEIVIGRETTRAIMMNEPELIRYLANYQQHNTRRLFDSGNVSDITLSRNNDITSEPATDPELRNAIGEMREVMSGVLYYLQHPVRPKISMYSQGGEDGLYDSMKKATAFMSRYGG